MTDGRERRCSSGYNFSSGSRFIGPSTGGELNNNNNTTTTTTTVAEQQQQQQVL